MTTAHRPTFDPARGKEALRGPAYHQRLLPAYTQLKFRQAGQGGDGDRQVRDLRAELLAAEAAHFSKANGGSITDGTTTTETTPSGATNKRPLEITSGSDNNNNNSEAEDPEAKRRRILAETREMDADDSGGDDDDDNDEEGEDEDDDDDDSEDSSDSDDEEAELARELERVRRERAEKREREERERAAAEEEQRERDIALGNPLLNRQAQVDFNMKRRWDDDVVFKNQARGTDDKGKKKEFINDLLRSDFHRRFMGKYVR